MINAANPAVGNTNLPPTLLDQDETSPATGANTNAAASAQSQTTNAPSDQGISALEYDANYSTTRNPTSADNNRMLMINPNSVNPNATRANVQAQMETPPNSLTLASSGNKPDGTNTNAVAAKTPHRTDISNNKGEIGKLAQAAKPSDISTKAWQDIVAPILVEYGPSALQAAIEGFGFVKDRHNENPNLSNKPNQLDILVAAGRYAADGDSPGDSILKFAVFKAAADATNGAWSRGLLGPNQ